MVSSNWLFAAPSYEHSDIHNKRWTSLSNRIQCAFGYGSGRSALKWIVFGYLFYKKIIRLNSIPTEQQISSKIYCDTQVIEM